MNPSNHVLKANCWKCHEIFTVLVRPADHNQTTGKVIKILPCPFCSASCELTLQADQVFSETISRGAGDTGVQRVTWAEQNEKERAMTVHRTQEPSGGSGSTATSGPGSV